MGRKNRMTVDFSGLELYQKKLASIDGDATKRAFESALKASQNIVRENVTAAMQRHTETGRTAKAIIKNSDVEWTGDTASIDVGFDITGGGLASIFLMYGTTVHGQPHIAPDRNLYNAVYGQKTRREVLKIQEEVFQKVIERAMKK
jgi:hypothetical protein